MTDTYYRPDTMEEALAILSRTDKPYLPLGGGSVISQMKGEGLGIVDLSRLGLDQIAASGNFLDVGATVTLEKFYQAADLPYGLKIPIYDEASFNLRQQATIAGSIVSADGRSSLAVALMALDAELVWEPKLARQRIGDWFSLRQKIGKMIVAVRIPINVSFAYASVARSPRDLPVVSVAIARWPSGRVRVALGGCCQAPLLALDGPEPGGIAVAVRNAFDRANDQWASAEYRQDAAGKLALRLLEQMA